MNELEPESISSVVVLLVVKDLFLNFFISESLEGAGFKVIDVTTTEEAYAALQTRTDINAVIVEYAQGGATTNTTLAKMIAKQFPHVALFITTDKTLCLAALPPSARILSKPFEPERITAIIRRAVDEVS
ncbi:hypothetical protein [Phyllobacterium sp. YR531]|uniref:hypothetical protein n=1 Tax=Phyllobacterium sp. YR531 TaxID=1144343 RepID=UPI00026FA109|nr:hypothetical protein [Phyllobacterium sp. YR531]EJN05964.1 response regulator with CheY-like receiver, AAA-type ATPase, and DNA-binding domains [Phyllobacterium sp. YR531]